MKDINYLKENDVDIEQSLELFGDVETYNETLKEFKNGITGKLEQIKKYYEEEDMPNYAIFVHSLKSDCKYFGFMKLASIAYDHEMQSKSNNLKFVKDHYDELAAEGERVKEIVFTYFNEYPSTDEDEDNDIYDEDNDIYDTNDTEESYEDNESSFDEETDDEIEEQEESSEKITDGNIILVVDDSEVVRSFVKKIFNDSYEIASANNGSEAIQIIKAHKDDDLIQAILLDLNMPKVDGFDVLDYLSDNDLLEKMPVTIISGESSSEAINRAFTYGIVDMINKPFSEEKISQAVIKTMMHKKQ